LALTPAAIIMLAKVWRPHGAPAEARALLDAYLEREDG
jgi:hypothetical protein